MFTIWDMIICGLACYLVGGIFGIVLSALMVAAGRDRRE